MTYTVDQARPEVTGLWHLVWRPEMAPSHTGNLEIAEAGDQFSARLESTLGSGTGTAVVEGASLTCTIQLDAAPSVLEFAAGVTGDQLEGTVRVVGRQTPFDRPATLSGARPGAAVHARAREGSDAVAQSLQACDVEYVFGYLGGCVPALHRSILTHDIPAIAARTELGAAWMSYGYNRVKNRAASAVLVWCVGAMHASPVVYAAKQDSTPLLFLTMESAPAWDMRDILQDASELYSSLKPLAKYIKRTVDAEDLPVAVRQAVLAASTGKFGPAVLNLTHTAMLDRTTLVSEELVLPSPPAAAERDLDRVAELLREAERPVILAGAGVHMAGAAAELRKLAEAAGIPVVTSGIGGRGLLPDDHPLNAGGSGLMKGLLSGESIAAGADLWIAVGYSFSQTATTSWTLPKPDRVIQVDVEENQIGRIFQPTLGIVADAREFLSQMLPRVRDLRSSDADTVDPRLAEIAGARQAIVGMVAGFAGQEPLTPIAIGAALTDAVAPETVVVCDEGSGLVGMFFNQDKYPNGTTPVIGGHYMSLGSGLPTAIGAKLADPQRPVVCYQGDSGFFFSCADLSTLAERNLQVAVIVNNNGGLFGGEPAGAAGVGPAAMWGQNPWLALPGGMDFVAVARGFGVPGERVTTVEELAPAIRRALDADGPYLLDVITDGVASYAGMMHALATDRAEKLGHLDLDLEGSWPS